MMNEQTEAGTERTHTRKVYVPKVDIYETNTEVVVSADMPGVDETSVDITLEKNVLTLRGATQPVEANNFNLAYAEYNDGDYERSFTLSNSIDQDGIVASVSQGVVTVNLPKADVAKKRTILVHGEP